MSKLHLASILGAAAVLAASSAFASGGMGDPSRLTREKNAICEMQRRGEGPLSPNMCLPEYPVNQAEAPQRARW